MFLLGLIVSLTLAIGYIVSEKKSWATVVVAWPIAFVVLAICWWLLGWFIKMTLTIAVIVCIVMLVIAAITAVSRRNAKA